MSKNLALVQGQLEAYNDGDLDRFCSYYHPEVSIQNLVENQIICSGMDQFRSIYINLFRKYPEQKCILKSRIIKDESIIDEELVLGRPEFPEGLHAVAIYSFKEDRIHKVWFL